MTHYEYLQKRIELAKANLALYEARIREAQEDSAYERKKLFGLRCMLSEHLAYSLTERKD